jgi:predicted dehydrogenase
MNTVRVAVVGLGYWGPNLVRNFNELACAEVVAVCDRDVERLELIQRRYRPCRPTRASTMSSPTTDRRRGVCNARVDAPPARTRAARGGKHVFVEKPLAASTSECLELIQLAESRGLC